MAVVGWMVLVVGLHTMVNRMESAGIDNATSIIQLGVIGIQPGEFSQILGRWTPSPTLSVHGVENVLYRISLDTTSPFRIFRQAKDIHQVSDTLLLSGDPGAVNSTLRLLADTVEGMAVYQALTSNPTHFCRLRASSGSHTPGLILTKSTHVGSHPQWTLLPYYCYHVTPVDPIVSLLAWLKWRTLIVISDSDELSDMLLPHLSGLVVNNKHYRLDNTTTNTELRALLLHSYRRKAMFAPHFILLCGWQLTERIFTMVQKMDEDKSTAMFYFTKWITIWPTSQLPEYSHVTVAMNNVLVVTLEAGLSPVIQGVRVPRCAIDAELWSPLGRHADLSWMGYWSRHDGLHVEHTPFPNFGFQNRFFHVGVKEWPPFIIENTTSNGSYSGLSIDMLTNLASVLNFSFTLVTPRDGEWGLMKGNQTWTGVPKDIIDGVMDFSIAPFAITEEKSKVMDFTRYYFFDYNVILMKRSNLDNSWRLVMDIFSWPVIMCTVAAVPTTALLIYMLEAWNPANNVYRGRKRLGQLVWYTYGALLSQGGNHIPVCQAGRTQVAFWWLFTIMLTATFSGNLIAFLTVPKSDIPFQTLKEMVRQTELSWGLTGGTTLAGFLQNTNISTYQSLWHGVTSLNEDPLSHVDRVLSGGYVFVCEKSSCEYYMQNYCDLTLSKQEFFPLKYAMAFPKDSPYTVIFSRKLGQLTEGGLVEKWKTDWCPQRNCSTVITRAKMMKMEDVQSAFYLLVMGIGLGATAIMCEKIHSTLIAPAALPTNSKTGHPQKGGFLWLWFKSVFCKKPNHSIPSQTVTVAAITTGHPEVEMSSRY